MEVQKLTKSDLNQLLDLIPEGWDTAMSIIESYMNKDFCLPIKITIDDKIVGTGTTIIHNDVAWLAHVMVHQGYRNQGIGKLITESLVKDAKAHFCETIYLVATSLGEPVYTKIGFEIETEYAFFKGEKHPQKLISTENIKPYNPDFKNEIENLDRQVSGEERMFHLAQYLQSGQVYLQNNKVKGFYLPNFGDGLIIANSDFVGLELLKLRVSEKDFAVIPIENEFANNFLLQNNFTETMRQKRMRLGKKRDWQPKHIYNRVGGNLG